MHDLDQPILLVEDNPDDRDLTMRALRQCHVANPVVVAEDGVQALDYLFGEGAHAGRDPVEVPALVLLDLKLPKLNGLDVLKRVRTHDATKLVPVVVLTSSSEEEDRLASYTLGANSYVRKPVDFMRFAEAATQLGVYWLVLNEPPPPPMRADGRRQ